MRQFYTVFSIQDAVSLKLSLDSKMSNNTRRFDHVKRQNQTHHNKNIQYSNDFNRNKMFDMVKPTVVLNA
jgi:hypothetical protein